MLKFVSSFFALFLSAVLSCSTTREVIKFDNCVLPAAIDGADIQAISKSFVEGPKWLGTYKRRHQLGPMCFFTIGTNDCNNWTIVLAQCDEAIRQ